MDGAGPGTEAGLRLVAGRYRLAAELGRGGMGVVWLADDQLVGRQVAVKELRPPQGLQAGERETYQRRALQEARSAARIDHPGAVTLYDVRPASGGDDAVYLIMELVQGPTLAQLIGQRGRLADATVAGFGLQLLAVLEAAHALGVVHRDIKPANILITPGGQVKLTDFGIAHTIGDLRLTRSGIMGTQAYLAPELFDSAPITPAADLWSLGATLYAAAEGRGPFDRDTTGATLRAILIDNPPAPRCSPALATALAAMLQRDPHHRATITTARSALHAAARATPATPAPATPPSIATTTTTTHPATTTAGPATTTPGAAPAPSTDPGPAAGPPQPRPPWAQLATTRSPAPPPQVPPLAPAPRPLAPARPRRTTAISSSVAAAVVLIAAAITGGILATSDHNTPAPQPRAIHSLIATLSEPGSGEVPMVAFSPDGQTLATANQDGSAYLWSSTGHGSTATLADPRGKGAESVAFSPDGETLAVGDDNGHAYLWSTASHTITATLANPAGRGMGPVVFSPDGKILATADEALPSFVGTIYLWNLASRKVIATLTDPHSQGVNSVAFSPDGQTLAAADINGRTYLWNTATHRITATLTDPYAGTNWVAFSPDGKTLATAGGAGSVYLWSIASKNIVATLTTPHTNGVNSVAFSPDGKTLVTTVTPIEKTVTGSKGSIGYLWNIATRSVIGTLSDPGGQEERDATFSPDGKTLATADDNGSAYLWG